MRTETQTVRIGEWLGPVDPIYDMRHAGLNPKVRDDGFARILEMAARPEGWHFSPSGFSTFKVVNVGMYDGWPFWRPTPAIGYIGPLGFVEVAFFYNLSAHNTTRSP